MILVKALSRRLPSPSPQPGFRVLLLGRLIFPGHPRRTRCIGTITLGVWKEQASIFPRPGFWGSAGTPKSLRSEAWSLITQFCLVSEDDFSCPPFLPLRLKASPNGFRGKAAANFLKDFGPRALHATREIHVENQQKGRNEEASPFQGQETSVPLNGLH